MKICSKCVMPETAESLKFDDNGSCSVCTQIKFKQTNVDWKSRGKEFDFILNRFRNKNDYDCIVPFSGGKDLVIIRNINYFST